MFTIYPSLHHDSNPKSMQNVHTITQTQNLCKMSTPSLKPKIYTKCLHHILLNEWIVSQIYIFYIYYFSIIIKVFLLQFKISVILMIFTLYYFLVKMRVFSFTMECHLLGFNLHNFDPILSLNGHISLLRN